MTVGGDDVRAAADAVVGLIVESDRWDERAGALTWSCRVTATHVVDCLIWYAGNLAVRSTRPTGGPELETTAKPNDLRDGLRVGSALLATVVEAADDDARGAHPYGRADRSGFAAMGCDETLIHGYDIALGLGIPYHPPAEPVERTLRRLFPWAPSDADPWEALLWANGRAPLGDRPPETRWLWHCAPLADWDGTIRRQKK